MTPEEARRLGYRSYVEGQVSAAPAHSFEIQSALKGREVGDPYNVEIMKAYIDGWNDAAGIAANTVLEEDDAVRE